MNLSTREQAGVVIVLVSGGIDHNARKEFTKALEPLLARCAKGCPALIGQGICDSWGMRKKFRDGCRNDSDLSEIDL